MNCIAARQFIQDELDARIPSPERPELEEHLKVCPRCLAYRDSLQALSRSFADLPPVVAPAELMQRLGFEAKPKWNHKAWFPVGIAAALLMGWSGWNFTQRQPAAEEIGAQQPAAESLYVWLTSYEEESEAW